MSDARSLLPLSTPQFQILLALVDADRHGYGIIRDVADRSGGAVRLGTGTLYTAVARLEALGLLEESPKRPRRADDDERRKYYRLTELGGEVLRAETARLAALVRDAQRKGIGRAPRPVWSRSK